MSELREAVMPSSLEAERSVLGAMLQDPSAVLKVVEELQPDDFYDSGHREIYSAMLSVYSMQRQLDFVSVNGELARRGSLEGVGGTAFLISLSQYVPTTANIDTYIAMVSENSTLRRLILAAQSIMQECYARQDPVPETLNRAEKSIFDIVMKRSSSEALKPINEVLLDTFRDIEELDKHKGEIAGVPTGFTKLDSLLTGLHPGELILIGARPSMGKTSFAINIATYAGLAAKRSVAFFSLEMPREQIAMRMLCSEAGVDMQHVRQGVLSMGEWDQLINAINPLAASRIYIDDTAGITPTQLRSRCRRLMMDHGLDLIVLDYLGLMRIDGKAENRQLEVSEISRSLKAIALELKVPLVACAQLSRAPVARSDKRPQLSDLRDSGSIEQDADVVMFLHREAYFDPSSEDKNIGEVIVAKQRNGPLDNIKLAWLPELASYTNLLADGKDSPY